MRKSSAFLILCVAAYLSTSAASAEDACQFVPIDTLGGAGGHVTGLNSRGQVVGTLFDDRGLFTAYIWQGGHTRALARLEEGGSTYAESINDSGQVVGAAQQNGHEVPVMWSRQGILRLPSEGDARPSDVNNQGQIVGNQGFSECLFWANAQSEPIVLGNFGGDWCFARAINDRGEVVGGAEAASGEVHAFVWRDGRFVDLGDFPHQGADLDAELLDINNRGLAVGFVRRSLRSDLLLWTRRAGPRVIEFPTLDLPLIANGPASSVNDWGLVIAHDFAEDAHLLLANSAGKIRDAGTLGGRVAFDDVFVNNRFQLAWDADLQPYFCQLRGSRKH